MKYFLTGLSLVLIAAKLFGAITISWTLALAPIWIPVAIALIVFVAVLISGALRE